MLSIRMVRPSKQTKPHNEPLNRSTSKRAPTDRPKTSKFCKIRPFRLLPATGTITLLFSLIHLLLSDCMCSLLRGFSALFAFPPIITSHHRAARHSDQRRDTSGSSRRWSPPICTTPHHRSRPVITALSSRVVSLWPTVHGIAQVHAPHSHRWLHLQQVLCEVLPNFGLKSIQYSTKHSVPTHYACPARCQPAVVGE